MRKRLVLGLTALVGGVLPTRALGKGPRETLLFVGTQGEGIFAARLNERTGALTPLGQAATVERPTWVLSDPTNQVLYAVSEVGNAGDGEGSVLSFAVDPSSGALHPVGSVGSGGGGATHLGLDDQGCTVFVANFGGGTVAAIPTAGGELGPVASIAAHEGSGPHRRQPGPRPHGVTLDPSGRYLLAPDMGADRVFVHRYEPESRALSAHEPAFSSLPAGSGPRLIVFGHDGRFAYLLTELSAELFSFRWDPEQGQLEQIDRRALDPVGADYARSAAAIAISRGGKRVYLSNRARGAIHVFAIDRKSGVPAEIQVTDACGMKPWDLTLAPSGHWLLASNQGSDEVRVFRIEADGQLVSTTAVLKIPMPSSVAFADQRNEGP